MIASSAATFETGLVHVAVLAAWAIALGRLAERARVPALIGEVAAGLALGSAGLAWVAPSVPLRLTSDAAILALVFFAATEIDGSLLGQQLSRPRTLAASMAAFLGPLAAGSAIAWSFGVEPTDVWVVGLAVSVSVSAVPVAMRILDDLGWLDSAVSRLSLATAILCDLLALGGIAALLAARGIAAAAALGPLTSFALLVAVLGLGMGVGRRARRMGPRSRHALSSRRKVIARTLVPIFFANLGVEFAATIPSITWSDAIFWISLVTTASLSKLALAGFLFRNGMVGARTFAALVIVGPATTLAAPVLLRLLGALAHPDAQAGLRLSLTKSNS